HGALAAGGGARSAQDVVGEATTQRPGRWRAGQPGLQGRGDGARDLQPPAGAPAQDQDAPRAAGWPARAGPPCAPIPRGARARGTGQGEPGGRPAAPGRGARGTVWALGAALSPAWAWRGVRGQPPAASSLTTPPSAAGTPPGGPRVPQRPPGSGAPRRVAAGLERAPGPGRG